MQFQVPQFIETEDKVVGPLTFRQFLYVGTAAGIIIALFFALNFSIWAILSMIIGGVGVGLAFGKVNERPITKFITSAVVSFFSPKLYVFSPTIPGTKDLFKRTSYKQTATKWIKQIEPKAALKPVKKPFRQSGLGELKKWLTASKTAMPRRENPLTSGFGVDKKKIEERYEVVRHLSGERELAKRIDFR